jgi:hypothetical protein
VVAATPGGEFPANAPARPVAAPFTLYSRTWCHLCEDLLTALMALPGSAGFVVDVIDVDADPALEARFNELVPVLFGKLDEPELCHYFLDIAAVERYLAACARRVNG